MCGIVGYVGSKSVVDILLNGLSKLEYRGYDSAGVAINSEGKIKIYKAEGKLQNLKDLLESHKSEIKNTSVGIGHIRWATHGLPNTINAHPHTCNCGKLAIVHNGIVENYKELKEELIKDGCVFKSETDTETVAHLIAREYGKLNDLPKAVRAAAKKLKGAYALCVMHQDEPNILVGTRKNAPLIVALGQGENYLASEALFLDESAVSMPQDGQVRSVSLTEFIEAFIYPDSWLMKALSISKIAAQGASEVSLNASFDDALLQKNFARSVLDQMKKGKSDEQILQVLALNPAMGLESARTSCVGAKVAAIRSGFESMQEAIGQSSSSIVKFESAAIGAGCYRHLKLPAMTVYENEDKERFVVLEAFSSTDMERAFLRFLALASVDEEISAVIVNFKAAGGDQCIYLRSARQAQLTSLPRQTMEVLMQIFEKQALEPPAMATQLFSNWNAQQRSSTEMTNGAPIWLGRGDRQDVQQRTQNLKSAVFGLQKLFEKQAASGKKRVSSKKKKSPVESFNEAAAAFGQDTSIEICGNDDEQQS